MGARRAIEELWWRRDEPAWHEALLWPLTLASLGYRAGAAIARARARPARAAVPTISIGNLGVGGAGKTPVALAIAARLVARGKRVAILSRGYGRSGSADLEVQAGTSARDAGDEPLLLKRRLPAALVLVGPRRAALAVRAVEQGAEVLVLDDGLQHHALSRDLDVLVADASNPLGNGRLLPRGPLREGLSALGRVGLLWLTRTDLARDGDAQVDRMRALCGGAVESSYAPAPSAPALAGRRVFLFAGIARPASFQALALALGADVAGARWFPDHHRFTARELEALWAAAGDAQLVTTEKDAVRLPAAFPALALTVELRISSGEDLLDAALDRVLAR